MKSNMYIKIITLIICLLCFISAMGCNSANNFQGNNNNRDPSQVYDNNNKVSNAQNENNAGKDSAININTSNNDSQAVAQPAPPIQTESLNEVISLLVKSDTKGYNEKLQLKYQGMFSRVKKCGFIYHVVTSDNVAANNAITWYKKDGKELFFIMPYARYEDAGIVSYVMFHEELYQVCIYNVDEKFLSETESISEYIKARLGLNVSNEMTESENTVCFTTIGDGSNGAIAFIDNDHYYFVKATASQAQLEAFINVLTFEKLSIE